MKSEIEELKLELDQSHSESVRERDEELESLRDQLKKISDNFMVTKEEKAAEKAKYDKSHAMACQKIEFLEAQLAEAQL
jgi:hypothetical protein